MHTTGQLVNSIFQMGVFVSCSAGNGGSDPISFTNVCPSITGISRRCRSWEREKYNRNFSYTLQRGGEISGLKNRVSSESNSSSHDPNSLCLEGTSDPHTVAGKIMMCDGGIIPRVQTPEGSGDET